MVFQVSKWYNTHYSGSVLKGYQFYEVQVIAVTTASGNGTYMYSTKGALTRTSEGGDVYTMRLMSVILLLELSSVRNARD